MNSLSIGCGWWGFRELPIKKHLEICQQFGFKTLEFGIGDELPSTVPLHPTQETVQSIRAQAEAAGIRMPFVTVENDFTLTDKDEHQGMLEHVLKAIHTASKFGVSHIRIFAGFTPAEAITQRIYQQVIAAFEECAALCQQYQLKISIETHGRIDHKDGIAFHHNTISTDPHFLEKLMKDLPIGVGFNYDPGNIKAVRSEDTSYCVDILNDRINYCHLKDWKPKNGGWVAAAIGDDDLDYAILLPKINFNGVYQIEYEPLEDLTDGIARSINYLEQIGYTLNYV